MKRETIVAGNLISRRYYFPPVRMPGEKRAKKKTPTREEVMKINRRNAERELTLKLHHNFGEGDIHAVLTYSGEEPKKERAKKELQNFFRRLRREFRKEDRILKWISVTEYQNHRIHHHVILPKMDTARLQELWTAGRVRPVHLDNTGDYRKLASYLIKETDKTFRDPDAFSKQRYSCSRTVVSPVRKIEDVKSKEAEEPKPIKGYHILEDSVYQGINPVTGNRYMEYMLISNTPEPRLRVWRRGKTKKYREKKYDPSGYQVDGQLEMDLDWAGYW